MTFHDRIYGTFDVNEQVLLVLLECPEVKRLKRIEQLGLPREFHIITEGFTRHEHSVGVMLLLRHLGASVEEQAAGLLHDVSHTAFSHMVDWFYNSERTESYQDSRHESFLKASGIPLVLNQHGLSVDRIVDYRLFPLLEADIPHLCADRVDYALRQMPSPTAAECFAHLTNFQNNMAFDSPVAAAYFADAYIHLQDTVWRGFEGMSRYRVFVRALERALELGRIAMEDFDTDDQAVMKKITEAPDPVIDELLHVLRLRSLDHLPKETTPSFAKPRFVDPLVVSNGFSYHLSERDPAFAHALHAAKKRNAEGVFLVSLDRILQPITPYAHCTSTRLRFRTGQKSRRPSS